MAQQYTSKKMGYFIAEQFCESFYEPEPTSVGYVFIGNHVPYADEDVPDEIFENPYNEKEVWKNIFALKKVTTNDVSLVVPKNLWQYGQIYNEYDDKGMSITTSGKHYISTETGEVFLCVSNSNGAVSISQPTVPAGDYTINDGVVYSSDDGYLWKYLYKVPTNSKFESLNYIPVPSKAGATGFNSFRSNLVDGAIYSVKIINPGQDYNVATIATTGFTAGTNIVQLASAGAGVANGVFVTSRRRLAILANTTVTYYDNIENTVTLSKNTNPRWSLALNPPLTFAPRLSLIGDGTGFSSNVVIANGTIQDITLLSFGSGYSNANVILYGTGTGAKLRAVIGPKFGHGFNPARELGANAVMIAVKIGGVDATEGGLIPDHVKYRQYGLLVNPYKYGNTVTQLQLSANNVARQLYDLTLTAGGNYIRDEFVYQGDSAANATFSGFVCTNTTSTVSLSKINGVPRIGAALKGTNITRYIVGVDYPEFEPFTGDILYVQNVTPVQRAQNQSEILRLVLTF